MDNTDYSYYEANAADISLEDITSSEQNKQIFQQLRDGDLELDRITLGRGGQFYFTKICELLLIREGDDLGWLGYFIGRSVKLQGLEICHLNLPEYEGWEQQIHAFMDGLARNQSIRRICAIELGEYESTALLRALGNWSQLEELVYSRNNLGPNGCSELGTLLESGDWKLKTIYLFNDNISDEGAAALAGGLRSIGPSLKTFSLPENIIGNEGLLALVTALESCTGLEELDLSGNDFSSAAAGLGSLSDWLQRDQMDLKRLNLRSCGINDEGLQALAEGATNHCKNLDLSANPLMASGLRVLSTSLQSNSCRLENLHIGSINIGDDGAEILARGLVGNETLRFLQLRGERDDDIAITREGWSVFATALCDTSSVNNTYLSNHNIQELWHVRHEYDEDFDIHIDESVVLNVRLNKQHPEYVAKCKILMNHAHLDMSPLLQWELKFLPLAVGWFESAKPCMTLSIHERLPNPMRRVLEESEEAFQSRALTSVYEFVRGVPKKVLERRNELALVAAYDEKISRLREDAEERDRKITQLEEENERLRGIVKLARNVLDMEREIERE
eukprot:scaffold4092_cov105-Skeletonema_dohrnii-CCMP3373.AAC.4